MAKEKEFPSTRKLEFMPVPGSESKKDLGLYHKDLVELGAKEGDWVGVRHGEKEITNSVRVVEKENDWKDRLVWISIDDAKSLELENDISDLSPSNPKEGLEVTVWKHTFPRDKKIYFAIFSTIIAILTTIFTFIVQAKIYPAYEITLGATVLGLTLTTIVSTAAVAIALKQ